MRKVLNYLKPYFLAMSLGLFIKFLGTITDLLLPYILSYIIDDVIPLKKMTAIYFWGIVMVLCAAVAVVTNIVANRMASGVARNTTEKLRHDLFTKISYLSAKQTDTFTVPSLISRLTSDTYNIHQMISSMQRLGIRAPILLIGGIIVTMTLEPVLTLILIATLPILGIVVYTVTKKGVPLYTKVQEAVDKLVLKVQENMTGVRVIKALSKSDYEKGKFDEINADVVAKEQTASIVMAVTSPVMNLLLNVGLSVVIVVGAYRVNAGVSQPGKIIAFLSYFAIILNALLMVTRMFVMYSKGAASAKRVSEVLDTQDDMVVIDTDHIDSEYHIEFNNVDFSYNKFRNNLTNINFKLKRGQTLGIIGATGSGKTTIINVLMRLYDIDSGEIRINGDNIKSIPNEILHTKFGVVFQNDFIFADTIGANIDYGRGIDLEKIKIAAESAQADFIKVKENGFDHMLTVKGANLSGGQKQRILISRALASNPEILILDDSSSALDYKTDANLRKAIYTNFKNTTTIIIAQRISSIKNADYIIMLDEGGILGSGSHEYLLETCSDYREISQAQMGGEINE